VAGRGRNGGGHRGRTAAVAAIQSAIGISSDGDKARVLLDAAERYSSDPAVT
jgi:hypothetical protein